MHRSPRCSVEIEIEIEKGLEKGREIERAKQPSNQRDPAATQRQPPMPALTCATAWPSSGYLRQVGPACHPLPSLPILL